MEEIKIVASTSANAAEKIIAKEVPLWEVKESPVITIVAFAIRPINRAEKGTVGDAAGNKILRIGVFRVRIAASGKDREK